LNISKELILEIPFKVTEPCFNWCKEQSIAFVEMQIIAVPSLVIIILCAVFIVRSSKNEKIQETCKYSILFCIIILLAWLFYIIPKYLV